MADNNNNGGPESEEGYQAPENQFAREQKPAVSAPPAKNMIFFGVIALVLIGIVYLVFSGSHSTPKNPRPIPAPRIPSRERIEIPDPPRVSPLPPVPSPPPAKDLLPPPPEPQEQSLDDTEDTAVNPGNKDYAKRLQANMIAVGGGGLSNITGSVSGITETKAIDNDPTVGFADPFFTQATVPSAAARRLGNTSSLIIQGKIIESVLETPINTELPGLIRAVVSHDVYAESGRAILIPKGSRIIGTYNNLVVRNNKRISIIWSRVIRPDGIDITISSPGTDQLGRSGVAGDVDNKYLEIFSGAFLVSAINIGVGLGVDSLQNKQISQTTSSQGDTTQTTTAGQKAGLKAIDLFSSTGETLIKDFINTRPTITIDQGTRISIFVNRDLVFPTNLSSGEVKLIQ